MHAYVHIYMHAYVHIYMHACAHNKQYSTKACKYIYSTSSQTHSVVLGVQPYM